MEHSHPEKPPIPGMPPKQPALPDFANTEMAFAHKSDKDLKRTYRIYKMIDSPFLTRIGPPILSLALKAGIPVKGLVRKTLYDIFCGGETLELTTQRSEHLYANKVMTILDYSVEGEKNEAGFDATMQEIIRTLEHGSRHKEVAFSAMKVTGISHFDLMADLQAGKALSAEQTALLDKAKSRLEKICETAHRLGQPVFVDAEETWIQDVIDQWTEEMMERFNKEKAIVVHTIQLYRKSGLPYLKELIARSKEKGYVLGVKLVRGAYLEKERQRAEEMGYDDPMQDTKGDTDHDFDAATRLCIENLEHIELCAGTHNQNSCMYIARMLQEKGLEKWNHHVLFAQLLGMSDNISFNLARSGFLVAKYLPYGPVRSVMPYLIRRAEENTAIAGQSSRELSLLKAEIRRRRI